MYETTEKDTTRRVSALLIVSYALEKPEEGAKKVFHRIFLGIATR